MQAGTTAEFLGGIKVFGKTVGTELELAEQVQLGFPSGSLDSVFRQFQLAAIPHRAIYEVIGSERTLQRKRRHNTRLSHDESDRLARLARLAVRAEQALGSREKAQRWLGKPNRSMDGRCPLELLKSDAGAVVVEDVLGRIEHGVFA